MRPLRLALAVVLASAGTALAHHRQTPPLVALTTTGDATLPRGAPPSRKAVAVVVDDGIAVVEPFRNPMLPTFAFTDGTNAAPVISKNGRTVAWDSDADPLASGVPGRQVLRRTRFGIQQVAVDPTGTSVNATIDLAGVSVAFESTGDLAGTGTVGVTQVFFDRPGGLIQQLSHGSGTSGHAALDLRGRFCAFDSTSDPDTGADTGIPQIWLADTLLGTAAPITAGAGASRLPAFANDGRLLVFESEAELDGDGHDTGVPQVFAYDTREEKFARVTNDATGCTSPTTAHIQRDWRVGYLCGGMAYFTMVLANQRFLVDTAGGDTTRLVPQADTHFVLVATSADLIGGGTTPEHRVYMVNLFKRPPTSVASAVTWFSPPAAP